MKNAFCSVGHGCFGQLLDNDAKELRTHEMRILKGRFLNMIITVRTCEGEIHLRLEQGNAQGDTIAGKHFWHCMNKPLAKFKGIC